MLDQVNEAEQMIKHYNEQQNDATKRFDDKINEAENLYQEINRQVDKVNYSLNIMITIIIFIASCSFGYSMYSIMNMMLNKT